MSLFQAECRVWDIGSTQKGKPASFVYRDGSKILEMGE
jgi:hypothetical protein